MVVVWRLVAPAKPRPLKLSCSEASLAEAGLIPDNEIYGMCVQEVTERGRLGQPAALSTYFKRSHSVGQSEKQARMLRYQLQCPSNNE